MATAYCRRRVVFTRHSSSGRPGGAPTKAIDDANTRPSRSSRRTRQGRRRWCSSMAWGAFRAAGTRRASVSRGCRRRGALPRLADDPVDRRGSTAELEVMAYKTIGQVTDHVPRSSASRRRSPLVTSRLFVRGRRRRSWRAAAPSASVALTLHHSAACSAADSVVKSRSGPCNPGNPAGTVQYRAPTISSATRSTTLSARPRPTSSTEQFCWRRVRRAALQAAAADLNPWTEAKVDTKNRGAGAALTISCEENDAVPGRSRTRPTSVRSATRAYRDRPNGGRGHGLTIDGGREGRDTALEFGADSRTQCPATFAYASTWSTKRGTTTPALLRVSSTASYR